MRITINITILLLFSLIAGCSAHQNDLAKDYNDFGIKCARMGLWNEAIMRWKRVIEIKPNTPGVYNNLAVAYESKGEMESALAAYKKATETEPDNGIYKANYIRFKRNYDKVKKMQVTSGKIQDEKNENQNTKTED
jgi:tetratricopeptide (TPR) repeat protein